MATNTYVALQTQTLSSSASSITFSSISQAYTDLVLVINTASVSGVNYPCMRFNGDSGTNYSRTALSGNGSTASSGRDANISICSFSYNAGNSSTAASFVGTAHIMNYSNATTYKTILAKGQNASTAVDQMVNLWRSTAAITSIEVRLDSGSYAAGSTFTLYGIAAEGQGYATGGLITSDANYYYHAFTSSGTFTPSKALTADILVVAGGGGGSSGAGGAGGITYFAAQSLANGTGYTCTVGAGGAANTGGNSANGTNGANSVFGSLTAAVGGGYGAGSVPVINGNSGGSGGGGGSSDGGQTNGGASTQTGTGATAYYGNAGGGNGNFRGAPYPNGGGGGAGAAGTSGTSNSQGGNGGNGISTYSSLGLATGTGENIGGTVWFAGGGGGGTYGSGGTPGTRGNGGGGAGSSTAGGNAGLPNTGGGGGGGRGDGPGGSTAVGGSGVIIVRYAK